MSEGPTDPHRPRVHLAPRRGWLNDPNGFVRWNGRYHLFFQHHPSRPLWGPPEWAHVVSDDLAHWTPLPPALTPEMPPADPDGCWSGSTTIMNGRPVVHYTGVRDGEQATCRAEPLDDGLVRWRKSRDNPIAVAPTDAPISYGAYRDPFVWQEPDGWRMIVGTSLDGRGAALHYASDDGRAWRLLGPLVDDDAMPTARGQGRIWECPLLLRRDGADDAPDLLIYGAWNQGALVHVSGMTGRYDGQRFVPGAVHRIDHGDHGFYAPQVIRDGDRWLMIGWIQEQRSDEALLEAGWAGVLSLPREVRIGADGLRYAFPPELAGLRGREVRIDAACPADREVRLPIEGRHLELRLRVERRGARQLALDLLRTRDGRERTRLVLDWESDAVATEKDRASRDPRATPARHVASSVGLDAVAEVHAYVDGSVLEVIVGGRTALSTRAYPIGADATGVVATAIGGAAEVTGSAWPVQGPVMRSGRDGIDGPH